MHLFGFVLILFAIWLNITTHVLAFKPIGVIVGILGLYLILRYTKKY
jgi:hypothetical protein